MQFYKNYQKDLIKSRETALLIELNAKDLQNFNKDLGYKYSAKNNDNSFNIALITAKEIYDKFSKNKESTNIVIIDSDNKNNQSNSILLEQIFKGLDDNLKEIYNLKIAKEGIKTGLSILSSGVSNLFTSSLDSGIEYITDSIKDGLEDFIADELINTIVDESTSYSLDKIKDSTLEKVNNNLIESMYKKELMNIYLSKNSKELLFKNSKKFNDKLSSSEIYQLVLKIIMNLAVDMPKVLFIKNPHKLDVNSISILSLLLSFSKNLKDEGKHTGVSIVYIYEDETFQPYQECSLEYKTKQKLLDDQRNFAQRYAMLEKPSSNIPNIAVKSHLFVGRTKELEELKKNYDKSKKNKQLSTIQVISADPGIGKTKLAKKHFMEIKKQESNGRHLIQLTLLNNTGHNSSNVGLSSLINSIIEEAQRLNNIKTLIEKGIDKISDSLINTAISTAKDLIDYNVVDTAIALKDRLELNKNTISLLQSELEDSKASDSKEEQFNKISSSIKTIESATNMSSPIILFIDDLQWIDETSAEYIFEHFIKKFNVHIVATMRFSDATTVLKKDIKNKSQNKYKIALLEKSGICINKEDNATLDIEELLKSSDKEDFYSNKLELKGFDLETLTDLIAQIIKGSESKKQILAKMIIETLTKNSLKKNVNTLFAVETINMLCDDKFYKNSKQKLIIKNTIDNKTSMMFNPEIKDFEKTLENTFVNLELNYSKSFKHPSTEDFTQNFNLMAYAVLEERLKILQMYFNEHGNIAVNTLLFSSLIGAPFNSDIVKNILEELSITKEPFLLSLKDYINKDTKTTALCIEHYQIIDEVYEILSRYVIFKNAYVYRHSLLNVFLDKQLEYTLDTTFTKNKIESKNVLFTLIIKNIIIDEREKTALISKKELYSNLEFYIIVINSVLEKVIKNKINISNSEELHDWFVILYEKLYSNGNYLVLNKSLSYLVQIVEKNYFDFKNGKEKYFELLWKCVSLNNRLFNKEAINYSEKMYAFIDKLEDSVENSILKGEFYYKIGGYKYLHISYSEGLKELFLSVKNLKQAMKSEIISPLVFDKANITLSYAYGRIGELFQRNSQTLASNDKKNKRLEKALKYHNLSLEINKLIVSKYPQNSDYFRKLGVVYERIGQTYRDLKLNKEAENNLLEAMKLKKTFYEKTKESFSYRKILIVLFDFYEKIDYTKAKECILLAEKTIVEEEYLHDLKNQNQYHIESYLKTYTRVLKFKSNTKTKEKVILLDSIVKSRGLSAEY